MCTTKWLVAQEPRVYLNEGIRQHQQIKDSRASNAQVTASHARHIWAQACYQAEGKQHTVDGAV